MQETPVQPAPADIQAATNAAPAASGAVMDVTQPATQPSGTASSPAASVPQPETTPPATAPATKPSVPKQQRTMPVGVIVTTVVIFVTLVAVAYLAYSKG